KPDKGPIPAALSAASTPLGLLFLLAIDLGLPLLWLTLRQAGDGLPDQQQTPRAGHPGRPEIAEAVVAAEPGDHPDRHADGDRGDVLVPDVDHPAAGHLPPLFSGAAPGPPAGV